MNMIEKVARAICKAQGEDPDKPICRGTGWKGRKVVTYWEYHEGDARAAIEAMDSQATDRNAIIDECIKVVDEDVGLHESPDDDFDVGWNNAVEDSVLNLEALKTEEEGK